MGAVNWRKAARIAADVNPTRPIRVGLTSAVGSVLAEPITSLADLPPFDCAEESGYAVRGIGPWTVRESPGASSGLHDGEAVAVIPGSILPPGSEAVLGWHESMLTEGAQYSHLLVGNPRTGRQDSRPGLVEYGHGIRPAGSSTLAGDLLTKAGATITAGTIALATAAGMDDLTIVPPPTMATVARNDGLLASGPPRRGRDRSIVASLAPAWAMSAGARCLPELDSPDEIGPLADTIDAAGADIVVVAASANPNTLNVAEGALDHLHAEILIEELACQPGGRITLAELRDGRRVVCLPADPVGAIVGLAAILNPSLASLAGKPTLGRPETAMLRRGVSDTEIERAIPVIVEHGELANLADPQPWTGPHGLTPLGTADGIAFIDPGRGMAQESVPVMRLPGTE
jgi:molybdopterin molybdotransferase